MSALNYPDVREDNIVDEYHGISVSDRYQWLEDLDSSDVKKFIRDQNQFTDSYLSKSGLSELRLNIKERVADMCDFNEYECPFRRGDRYFYFNNNILYTIQSLEEYGEGVVVFDPSIDIFDINVTLSTSSFVKSGEAFGERLYAISHNGEILAYGLSKDGSDWSTIHFKNVVTAEYYPDKLEKVKDCYLSWTHDNKGLFYGRYPDTHTYNNEKIFYHILGTMQSEDQLVIEFEDNPTWELKARVSDCGCYLIVYALQDCGGKCLVFYMTLSESLFQKKSELLPIVNEFVANYDYITNVGSLFYFLTNEGAPNSRILKINICSDEKMDYQWKCVVSEHPIDILDWASCVNQDYLVTCYTRDVRNILQLRKLNDGSLVQQFQLGLGTITGFSGRTQDTEMFFMMSSFLTPGTISHVDFKQTNPSNICTCPCFTKGKVTFRVNNEFKDNSPEGFDPKKYIIFSYFYHSKDGTRIPLFIVHKKNLVKNGRNPCILYGYGGFHESVRLQFDATNIAFIQSFDGIYAQANIRGGGEYGQRWYEDGIRLNKQNCFDDFQAAAEYLIKEKYTCREKLAIKGNSNGGLLVGACINQRPDLFGAAVAGFGVMELLRFHRFTTGSCWISDYGCSEDKVNFENLLVISPLHNVKAPDDQKTQYPAVLLIAGDHDDRVVPSHSFKMIAELQKEIGKLSWQKNPFLIRVETNVGHGDAMTFDTSVCLNFTAFFILILNLIILV
ncbi:Prolyl endopeptidase [Orchesella cincta]|uniref:Prolyl endopeptidase n=1 Tax=Orchesella cincta TaxID=48709 RepID=A0A1D2MT61_ORCCI|nr:Prolyl endopeptidase [Orchesella cincta]